jgi:DNA-directed RNA polymerase specialized sigma24 family protein
MKFSWGLTSGEIGAKLGRSEGAVKQLVHRALRALRANLEEVSGVRQG